tara:strand:+ start:72 stop:680 length:609 start_codon:yes stop_codon:yes gene_type:complete
MKRLILISLFSFFVDAQEDMDISDESTLSIPAGSLYFISAFNEEEDSSTLVGGGIEINWSDGQSPLAGLIGIAYESQDWGNFSSERWNFYLGANAFFDVGSNMGSIGIKRTLYFGDGQTEEALDCIYCSNVEEEYSGGNFFASVGMYFDNNWMAQLQVRLSDKFSEWNENSYDPFGVGYSGSSSFKGIPDPKVQFSIGYYFQ